MQVAAPTTTSLSSSTHTPSFRSAGLVALAVLVAHLGWLSSDRLWWRPSAEPIQPRKAFVTRQIQLPAQPHASLGQSATPPASKSTTNLSNTPAADFTESVTEKAAKPSTFADAAPPSPNASDLGTFDNQDFTAPVALPARVASGIDMPPYPRFASDGIAASDASSFKIPASALLKYQVTGMSRQINYSAWAELNWQQDGQRYDAKLEVGAFLLGTRSQNSQGTLGAEGLMPTRFGDKYRTEIASHFQRDKGVISFSTNAPDVAMHKGAQDRLSVVIQIAALLAADPERFPPGTMLAFQTVASRDAEVWLFQIEKSEAQSLPYGELQTLKVNRKPRKEFDQSIELWLAPSLGYLPVRLRVTNANGDFVDQQLSTVAKP